MTVTNRDSGTNVYEIAERIYRINTPVAIEGGPGGFSFNQYLIADDEPLLFHTGLRKMFPLVREAVTSIVPPERLRYIAFSHVEADECGSLNEWLAAAPFGASVRQDRSDGFDRRPRRSARAGARRRRNAVARQAFGALVRYAAPAARLGMRFFDGTTDQDAALRRSLHAAGRGREAAGRV